jgi:hypothetical protein
MKSIGKQNLNTSRRIAAIDLNVDVLSRMMKEYKGKEN